MDLATVVGVGRACGGYEIGKKVGVSESGVLLCKMLVMCEIGFKEDGSLCKWRDECDARI